MFLPNTLLWQEAVVEPVAASLGNWLLVGLVLVGIVLFGATGWRNKMPRDPRDDGFP